MQAVILDAASLGTDIDLQPLAAAVEHLQVYGITAPEQVLERIAGCELVIVNKVVLNAVHFAANPQLRLVAVTATGTNNIDLAAAARHGISVRNVQHYGTATLVQHTFSLILALSNHLLDYVADVRAGKWAQSSTFCLMEHPIRELEGKTLGIIGYGDLGQAVARMGQAFGMRVLIAERRTANVDADDSERLPLDEMLRQADVLSLHCLLSEQTRNLIGARELALMKADALLINTARGGIVDEAALAAALRAGRLGGAATDVLTEEPPRHGNALLAPDLPNLIVTPHCAWASREARQRLINMTADNIKAFTGPDKTR